LSKTPPARPSGASATCGNGRDVAGSGQIATGIARRSGGTGIATITAKGAAGRRFTDLEA
jgi:hypothetical protein